jgi:hypothetical protein
MLNLNKFKGEFNTDYILPSCQNTMNWSCYNRLEHTYIPIPYGAFFSSAGEFAK